MQFKSATQGKLLHTHLSGRTLFPDAVMAQVSHFVTPFQNCQSSIGNYVSIRKQVKTHGRESLSEHRGYIIGCKSHGSAVIDFRIVVSEQSFHSQWFQDVFTWNGDKYASAFSRKFPYVLLFYD